MDLVAAISSVDPPSLVAWLVLAFSASLYPLGVMLGTDCSPCCNRQCGDLPYKRCRRTECLTCSPTNGFSLPISRIDGAEDVLPGTGATAVCARHRLSVGITGSTFIHLSAGENLSITATQYPGYEQVVGQPGPTTPATITPAVGGDSVPGVFTLYVQGVDVPLTVETRLGHLPYLYAETTASRTEMQRFGNSFAPRASVSAPLSIHTRAVAVTSNSKYLDPSTATEAALLSMLTWSAVMHNAGDENYPSATDEFYAYATLAPIASVFKYLPANESVGMTYRVEYRRGTASVYRTIRANVYKPFGQAVEEIPENGFAPLTLPTYALADTPNTQRAPVVNGTSVTVWSNTTTHGRTQDYFYDPVGTSIFWPLSQIVSPAERSEAVSRRIACESPRYAFDPTGARGRSFSFPNAPYNFDFDAVADFIAGGRCLQWSEGSSTYERCIEPSNVLCGLGVCDRPWLLPQTATFSIPTPCTGAAFTVVGRLYTHSVADAFYSNSLDNCRYYAAVGACRVPLGTLKYAFPAASFFDGDLLYSLENGPSRSTLALPATTGWNSAAGFGSTTYSAPAGTVTLGGTVDPAGISFLMACPDGFAAHYSGKCLPDTASVSVNGVSIGDVTGTNGQVLSAEDLDTLKELANDVAGKMNGGTVTRRTNGLECTSAVYSNDTGGLGATPDILSAGVSLVGECGVLAKSGSALRYGSKSVGGKSFLVGVEATSSGGTATGRVSSSPGNTLGIVYWSVSGTVSVSASTTAATKQFSAATVSPATIGWRGGSFSFASSGTGGPNPNGTSAILPRFDGLRTVKPAGVLVAGFLPAIAEIAQDYRPCGIIGISITKMENAKPVSGAITPSPPLGVTGLVELFFEGDTPCDDPYTVTPSVPWIEVTQNADLRSFCINVLPNGTGSPRSGVVSISPVWLLNGAPSNLVAAEIGTYEYQITQSA